MDYLNSRKQKHLLWICYPLFWYFSFLLNFSWTLTTLMNLRAAKTHLICYLWQELATEKPHLTFSRGSLLWLLDSAMLFFSAWWDGENVPVSIELQRGHKLRKQTEVSDCLAKPECFFSYINFYAVASFKSQRKANQIWILTVPIPREGQFGSFHSCITNTRKC